MSGRADLVNDSCTIVVSGVGVIRKKVLITLFFLNGDRSGWIVIVYYLKSNYPVTFKFAETISAISMLRKESFEKCYTLFHKIISTLFGHFQVFSCFFFNLFFLSRKSYNFF